MKNNTLRLFLYSFLLTATFFACKKRDFESSSHNDYSKLSTKKSINGLSAFSSGGTCVSDTDDGSGYDSILRPTILGDRLIDHPYSLAHMQEAYLNLYGSSDGVAITHKYVRFKPSDPQQLSILLDLDIDLFDHPLDYEIVQEGDYYDDGVTPAEEIPWLYAVVNVSFTPPPGITYEELEQIHVPVLAAVENEAFRITGNPFDDYNCGGTSSFSQSGFSDFECAPGYHWNPDLMRCVPDDPIPPPPPAPARQPSGTITVTDDNFSGTGINPFRPVRNARVIAQRFLKIERTYTNTQGQFFINKEFNKVHVQVQFKNDQAIIRGLRRVRLWQMLFAVERDLGTFKGTLNNIQHNIPSAANALTDGARHWAAATAHNCVQEYYDFASLNHVGTPPAGIKILLTNWHVGTVGSTPMFAKRVTQELPEDFVAFFVLGGPFNPMSGIAVALKKEVDMTIGYNSFNDSRRVDETANPSDLSETMFHELTHAAHYNKVGNAWWNDFVDNGEMYNILHNFNNNPPYGYGDQGATSDIIALGESWAYHMGHFMADWKYGMNSGPTIMQRIQYNNNDFIQGSSHINAVEDFNPARTFDPDAWIPNGLYYDLIDNRNDIGVAFPRVAVDDQVLGFTNEQFFNALDADIRSLPSFRVRLLNENANSQAAAVNTIFTFYNVF